MKCFESEVYSLELQRIMTKGPTSFPTPPISSIRFSLWWILSPRQVMNAICQLSCLTDLVELNSWTDMHVHLKNCVLLLLPGSREWLHSGCPGSSWYQWM